MNTAQYLTYVDQTWDEIQQRIEDNEVDVDCIIIGSVFTIETLDKRQIVINRQEPKHELWLASTQGAYHFVYRDGDWYNTAQPDTNFWYYLDLAFEAIGQEKQFLEKY